MFGEDQRRKMATVFIIVHRQNGEGSFGPEIFYGTVFMRKFVGDVANDGALAVIPVADRNIQPVADKRAAPIGTYDEAGEEPITLMKGPDGAPIANAVVGFACTGGAGDTANRPRSCGFNRQASSASISGQASSAAGRP